MKIQLATTHENRRVNVSIGVHVHSVAPCETGLRVKRTTKNQKKKKEPCTGRVYAEKENICSGFIGQEKTQELPEFSEAKARYTRLSKPQCRQFSQKERCFEIPVNSQIIKHHIINLSSRYNQAMVIQGYGRFVNMVIAF